MSIKSINGKSPIVVGPWGGTGGYPWDDGVYSTIRQIVISHGAAIDSIRIEYDLKGRSVWSETHGGTDGGSETDKVKLDFPDEVLVSVSGHYGSVCGTPVIIRSLTFQSNSSKYGPFGTEDGTPFSLPVSSGKIIGFHGRSGSYLNSIGFYLKQVHFPSPMDSSPSPRSLPSVHSRNGYSFTGSDTGPEMVLSVRDRGDSYAVYASNHPKQQYTNPSPDYNGGALWNKMVSFPSYYGDQGAPAINVPQTYGPWGGSGGTIFDDGVYTGVWQINLTRAVGISSMKVLYDRNGQAVWGNKHGFSGGVIPDKIIFDFPSEVLTHITGFYDSAIIMGPTVVRSLTFHTNKRTYGPYGDEYGTYFSTSFTNGRIVGFHGREGWYIDGIGVHVQEGKVAPQRFVSRPTTMSSPSLHYNTLAPAQSDTYTDNEFAYGMVKEPVPMGPGPWGGEGGRPWDDGVYSGVKQVYVMRGAFIGSIQVEYDRGGYSVWSARHGNSGHITHRVKLDYPHEVLTCVYGYYNTSREDGPRVLRSLTFITNRGKYGPFGDEGGAYFSSATTEGKVVGFHGRSGQHLDAIGVHMQHWLADRRPAPNWHSQVSSSRSFLIGQRGLPGPYPRPGASDRNFPWAQGHIRNVVPRHRFDPPNGKYLGRDQTRGRDRDPKNTACTVCPSAPRRVRKRSGPSTREAEMAASEAAAAAAAAPAEGSVIAIHSLDEWSIQIDEANSAKKLVVIDFTASWCPPCRMMAPIFADMAKKSPNAVFLKVDVDEMKTIAEQFAVEAMPTFLFMKEGDVKDRVVGAMKEELANKLQLHITQ